MKVYHGTTVNKAFELVRAGKYQDGHTDNPWSAAHDEGGLYVTNIIEYAAEYGDTILEIEVDEASLIFLQDCPIGPGDYGWKPEFEEAREWLIPEGVCFSARIIR